MKKQAQIDWPTVMKLFAGGALTGAGLGAGTSFMRYLQSLKDQNEVDTSSDDDVLYLNIPEKPRPAGSPRRKMASTATFATGGLAGVLGTILAYNAVRNAYQKQRKKQLQTELDSAQNVYLGNLQQPDPMAKKASQFSALTKGVGSIYLALFLSALGSGVVANRMLQKQFPPLRSPNRNRPRKIVVRGPNDEGGISDETIQSNSTVTPDALEGLVRTNLNMPKVANADGSIADLVAAVAAGRGEEFKDNMSQFGIETALDLCKGARHEKISSLNRNLAITWVCADPYVSEAIQPLVAAEFQEGGGGTYIKMASEIAPEFHDALVGLTEAATRETRKSIYAPITSHCKAAMDIGSMGMTTPLESIVLAKGLGSLLSNNQPDAAQSQNSGDPSADDSETGLAPERDNRPGATDTHVSSDSRPPDVELDTEEAKDFWKRYGHDVDNVMAKV